MVKSQGKSDDFRANELMNIARDARDIEQYELLRGSMIL